jgi:menaquinone-dependent protoporphyrinogen oxidase
MSLILVAYHTKYGSTREVAERIALRLAESGHDAEARDVDDVKGLEGLCAVVVGGPLYFFRWSRDTRHFLKRYRGELKGLPVAVFGMGPIEDTAEQFEGARQQLDKALGKLDWLDPVAVEVFGGKVDPDKLRFPDNNPAFKNMGQIDLRDWDAIDAWAQSLPAAFGLRD